MTIDRVDIKHFHLFCGIGGGARGFNAGSARLGALKASFRCIGGVDSDARAIADFGRLTGSSGTVLDLFSREQYTAFHGQEPPATWREAGVEDVRRAAGGEAPDIVFQSSPCKGFSGLLNAGRAGTAKYQALNQLAIRGVMLTLAAWEDDPPAFILFENVPRIATRGRHLLDQVEALLIAAGYSVAETVHDCGELGALAQHRKRFLLVARHRAKVPPFLYEPPKRRVLSVGEVIGPMAMPDDPAAGPMHRLPRLSWDTWVRLALIPAGGDWRALRGLEWGRYRIVSLESRHQNQMRITGWERPAPTVIGATRPGSGAPSVADPRNWHSGVLGVREWDEPSVTVTGRAGVTTGAYSISDPRPSYGHEYGQLGVNPWDEPSRVVTGQVAPGQGRISVADPRWGGGAHGVTPWDAPASTVPGESWPSNGRFSLADPRPAGDWGGKGKYRVTAYDEPAGTVIAASATGNGAAALADPRGPRFNNVFRIIRWDETSPAVTGGGGPSSGGLNVADPRRAGNFGVVPFDEPAGAVTGAASADSGRFSVADPRLYEPGDHPDPPPILVALDETWHRPFTTLELAVLQGFPAELFRAPLVLAGSSHSRWREAIGNAVPPPTATAIASVMGRALLAACAGESFALSAEPIWVHPIAALISMDGPDVERGAA